MNTKTLFFAITCLLSTSLMADTAPEQRGIAPELVAHATTARMTLKIVKDQADVDQAAWQKTCAIVNELDSIVKKGGAGYLQALSQTCDETLKSMPKGAHALVFPELLEQTRTLETAANEVAFSFSLSKSVVNPEAWAQVIEMIKTLRSKETADYRDVKVALLTIIQFGQGDGSLPAVAATPAAPAPAPTEAATKTECPK